MPEAPASRSRAIIAIFGSTEPWAIALAQELGVEVARRGHIVLSGGTGPGSKAVKDSAIMGAGANRWIGVDPDGLIGVERKDTGLVIHTGLGHKRNYLEAHLSDAAIAIKGGDGTVSEATFALSLGRPVALAGAHWTIDGFVDDQNHAIRPDKMLEVAFRRVGRLPTGHPDFDALLNEAAIRTGLGQPGPHQFLPAVGAAAAMDWILSALSSTGLRGAFPPLSAFGSVATAYQDWIGLH